MTNSQTNKKRFSLTRILVIFCMMMVAISCLSVQEASAATYTGSILRDTLPSDQLTGNLLKMKTSNVEFYDPGSNWTYKTDGNYRYFCVKRSLACKSSSTSITSSLPSFRFNNAGKVNGQSVDVIVKITSLTVGAKYGTNTNPTLNDTWLTFAYTTSGSFNIGRHSGGFAGDYRLTKVGYTIYVVKHRAAGTGQYSSENDKLMGGLIYQQVRDIDVRYTTSFCEGFMGTAYYFKSMYRYSGYSGKLTTKSGETSAGNKYHKFIPAAKDVYGNDNILGQRVLALSRNNGYCCGYIWGGSWYSTLRLSCENLDTSSTTSFSKKVRLYKTSDGTSVSSSLAEETGCAAGDTVQFALSKTMPTFYVNTFNTFTTLEFKDTLPADMTYSSCTVYLGSTKLTKDTDYTLATETTDGRTKVTVTLTKEFRKNKDNYAGKVLRAYIYAKPKTKNKTYTNTGYIYSAQYTYDSDGDAVAGPTTSQSDTAVVKTTTTPMFDITKTETTTSDYYQAGDTVEYDVVAKQTNAAAGKTNTTITDTLPAGLTLVSSTCSVSATQSTSGQVLTYKISNLAANTAATVHVVAKVQSGYGGQTLTNTATVYDTDDTSNTKSATASIAVENPILEVDKSIYIEEADGEADGDDVESDETEDETVAEDETTDSGDGDSDSDEVGSSSTQTVIEGTYSPNDTFKYQVVVQNAGLITAKGVTITDVLPDYLSANGNVTYVKGADTTSGLTSGYSGKTYTMSSIDLAPEESVTLIIPVKVNNDADGKRISNTVTAKCSNAEGSDTTVIDITERDQYIVSFDANGGTGAPASISARVGTDLTLPSETPELTGHTFAYWTGEANESDTEAWTSRARTFEPNGTYIKRIRITKMQDTAANKLEIMVQADNTTTVKVPTWTSANGQDDLVWHQLGSGSWTRGNQTYNFGGQIKIDSHNNEILNYITHVYAYDSSGATLQSVNTNPAYDIRYDPEDTWTRHQNTTLYAQYKVNQYKATFNANGGSEANPKTITKNYGTALGTLPTTSRPGYTFNGWYTTKSGGSKISSTTTMPAYNVTYYAQWTPIDYTLTFDANGGSVSPTSKSMTYGTITTDMPTPIRTGYTSPRWYAKFTGSNYLNLGREYMYEDKISVHFDAYMSDWSACSSQRLISCTESGGWNIESNSGYIQFAGYDKGVGYKVATSSKTWASLSAGWHTFDLVFDGSKIYGYVDGSNIATSTAYSSGQIGYNSSNAIFVGAEAGANASTSAGSYFNGYISNLVIKNDSSRITSAQNNFIAPCQDMTLYAEWEPNIYTVTYDANGGTGAPAAQNFKFNSGDKISTTVPTRTGYTFVNWVSNPNSKEFNPGDAIPNGWGSFTLVAQWEKAILNVTKAASDTTPAPNGTFNYTVTVKNTGKVAAESVIITDALPDYLSINGSASSITIKGASSGTPNASVSGKTITVSGFNLNSGSTATITIPVKISNNAGAQSIKNTINVKATNADETTGSCTITVETPKLSITKEGTPDPAAVNETITYTLTINQTNSEITKCGEVTVKDVLPTGLTPGSVTSKSGGENLVASFSGQTLTITADSITTGTPIVVKYTASASAPGSYTNTVTASVTGGTDKTASETVTIAKPTLSVIKTTSGAKSSDSITITNLAEDPEFNKYGNDTTHVKYGTKSLKLTGTTSSAEVIKAVGTAPIDNTHKYYVRYEVYQETVQGSFDAYWGHTTNTSSVSEPRFFGGKTNASANKWNVVSSVDNRSQMLTNAASTVRLDYNNSKVAGDAWLDGLVIVDLTESFGSGNEPTVAWCDTNIPYFEGENQIAINIVPNGTFNYVIKVKNTSDVIARGVVVTDELPDYISLNGAASDIKVNGHSAGTPSVTYSGKTVTASGFVLDAGATATITIPVKAANDAGSQKITNTASTKGTYTEKSEGSCTVTVATPVLSVTKEANVSKIGLNSPITYTLTINQTNEEIEKCGEVTVKDVLPDGLAPGNIMSKTGCADIEASFTGKTLTVKADSITTGTPIVVTYTATATTTGKHTNTATASIDGGKDVTDSFTIEVGAPEITVTKTASAKYFSQGDTIEYTITPRLITQGIIGENFVITDELPDGTSYVTSNCNIETAEIKISGNKVTCTFDEIVSTQKPSITIKTKVNGSYEGDEITNTVVAEITGGKTVEDSVTLKARNITLIVPTSVLANGSKFLVRGNVQMGKDVKSVKFEFFHNDDLEKSVDTVTVTKKDKDLGDGWYQYKAYLKVPADYNPAEDGKIITGPVKMTVTYTDDYTTAKRKLVKVGPPIYLEAGKSKIANGIRYIAVEFIEGLSSKSIWKANPDYYDELTDSLNNIDPIESYEVEGE